MRHPPLALLRATSLVLFLGATAHAESPEEVPHEENAPNERPSANDQTAVETVALLESHPSVHVRNPRFSDGPRQVPRARGAAAARARTLGIGDHASTRRLLWSRPSPELLKAVPGTAPRTLLWPVVRGHWGRGFGFTRKIRTDLRHNGIDIGAPMGTPVRAAADGIVIFSDNSLDGFGNAVMILHPGGYTTLYGHNLRTTVQPGWYVKRGERIALVGATGMAWGPHVHFEFRDNGRWRDPKPLLTGYEDSSLNGPMVELREESGAKTVQSAAKKDDSPGAGGRPKHGNRTAAAKGNSRSKRQLS